MNRGNKICDMIIYKCDESINLESVCYLLGLFDKKDISPLECFVSYNKYGILPTTKDDAVECVKLLLS